MTKWDPARPSPPDEEQLAEWAEIREEAARLAEDTGGFLRRRVQDYPIGAALVAAGLGFAAGGGLPRSATTILLGVGARFAASFLSEEINAALGDAPDP